MAFKCFSLFSFALFSNIFLSSDNMPGTVTGAVHVLVYSRLRTILGLLSSPFYNEKTKAQKAWVTSLSKWQGRDSKRGIWFPKPRLLTTGPHSPPLIILLDFFIALIHVPPPTTTFAHPIVLCSFPDSFALRPLFFQSRSPCKTLQGTFLTNVTHSDHGWLHITYEDHLAYLLPRTPTLL